MKIDPDNFASYDKHNLFTPDPPKIKPTEISNDSLKLFKSEPREIGILIGRFCPLHNGHINNITEMVENFTYDNCILLIGSCNSKISLRNFFSFKERYSYIKEVFPYIKSMGLPDFPGDDDNWFFNLYNLLEEVFDGEIARNGIRRQLKQELIPVFYGGCIEDLFPIIQRNHKFHIVPRFDSKFNISATQVRDYLIQDNQDLLNEILPQHIIPTVTKNFKDRWELFKRM